MSSTRPAASRTTSEAQTTRKGGTFAAAFTYSVENGALELQAADTASFEPGAWNDLAPRRTPHATGMNGYTTSPDPPPALYVRALYDYDADDHTSLSFRKGDVIQVLTQLESGWWDGVINDVRGWFPSNYCVVISSPDDPGELGSNDHDESDASVESGTEEEEYEEDGDSEENAQDEESDLPIESPESHNQEEAAFWIPQATPDGRLFYFNTLTGVSTMELPLETPTSADETGPRDRTNFHVPEQTRPPPEMMARGLESEEDYDGSASEADGDSSLAASQSSLARKRRSLGSATLSPSTSTESMSMTAARNNSRLAFDTATSMTASQQINTTMAPLGTGTTSFTATPHYTMQKPTTLRYFVDDGSTIPLTWDTLVENMRSSVESYRQAIRNNERAEFVRRAEDISDHLRMLLAAGSGTTDNHSGNPSIISTNKPLYPHFREMMSKFSKLVLSSHIAAADWPGPEASTKCLQEAEGVMHGVYGYVEVARQQRGRELPRTGPGFVLGSSTGGNWQDNNVDSQNELEGHSFMDHSQLESPPRAFTLLDVHLLKQVDDARKLLLSMIRRLEDQLPLTEKVVSPSRQEAMGDVICLAAAAVIEQFRPWINHIESIDLASLGNVLQTSKLVDFGAQKQKAYDSIGELVATCQAVTVPLPDEWAESRGEPLEARLKHVRNSCKELDSHVTQIGYSLQHMIDATSLGPSSTTSKRDHRMTDGGETYQNLHIRSQPGHVSNQRPLLSDIGHSQSYTIGQEPPLEKIRRPLNTDKARQFFGQLPPSHAAIKGLNTELALTTEESPWYLQLDHPTEVNYDFKTEPPQLKSGTLTGLVEQLTRHDRLDASFNGTFLLTYRSFTSAKELFDMLVKRFNIQPPPGLTRDEFLLWEDRKQRPVRFRVLNILKSWFEHYWMENSDEASQKLLEIAYNFVKTSAKTGSAGQLMTVIEQRIKGQDTSAKRLVLTLTNTAPASIVPKNMKKLKFLDIDPTEFARQLTIVESKLYGKIRPIECLDKTWQKKPKSENAEPAPNVKSLILHSNQLTNWVAEMILMQTEVRKRVAVIKHFVTIADRCRSMNNFSTLTSIVSALGTAPVLRLQRTWTQVNGKTTATLESMRQLMASTKNFGLYREQLHQANPPCIPFLGVYLTDLTFIEDGIPSVVKNTELINFTKRAKTAEVIRDIQQYQNVPYSLNSVPDLQEWILDNMKAAGDVHEMYNRSLLIEPREKEEDKINRVLSEAGFV